MATRPISFLSDYGYDDEFVGVCRGVIARIAPDAALIDITHGIERGDVRAGALALARSLPFTPPGVHLAVVDPGVGGDLEGRPVLIARAAEARDVVPDGLRDRGAEVDVVALYETQAEKPSREALEAIKDADYVTFTSSSTVTNFLEAVGGVPDDFRIISIGPVTSETAVRAGLRVHAEAKQHDIDGLIEALLADES